MDGLDLLGREGAAEDRQFVDVAGEVDVVPVDTAILVMAAEAEPRA
jgi:hypothetical protein